MVFIVDGVEIFEEKLYALLQHIYILLDFWEEGLSSSQPHRERRAGKKMTTAVVHGSQWDSLNHHAEELFKQAQTALRNRQTEIRVVMNQVERSRYEKSAESCQRTLLYLKLSAASLKEGKAPEAAPMSIAACEQPVHAGYGVVLTMRPERRQRHLNIYTSHLQHYVDQGYTTDLAPPQHLAVSEILTTIFLYLPCQMETLFSCSAVSHAWRERAEHLPQWKVLIVSEWENVSSESLGFQTEKFAEERKAEGACSCSSLAPQLSSSSYYSSPRGKVVLEWKSLRRQHQDSASRILTRHTLGEISPIRPEGSRNQKNTRKPCAIM